MGFCTYTTNYSLVHSTSLYCIVYPSHVLIVIPVFFLSIFYQELEDTIESLRQQISVLQSRARVLQEELDTRNQFSSSFNVSSVREQDEL